ncbi:MAG: preprotein translocase subunit SecG [Rhodobacteraceae bacterium CG17_big_fil_post_rev_8_21_14_2_50_65_11]|nr:MAG: preprotein translocase subunit SecG [Rhodobacteraceae bacterium CG17_big_fil_post_rev_8_21_14_2_50_65_11]
MENVILVVHLILAICLIGVVLLQRSEGGGLGIGGGGGGAMTGRAAASALGKVTWGLAIAFLATSITLTIIAAQNAESGSVLDRIGNGPGAATQETDTAPPALPGEGSLLPPPQTDAPLAPPRAD